MTPNSMNAAPSPSPRPRKPRPDRRTATAIRFAPEVHARLLVAAEERDVSINWLVNRAVVKLLDELIPVDEWRLTR